MLEIITKYNNCVNLIDSIDLRSSFIINGTNNLPEIKFYKYSSVLELNGKMYNHDPCLIFNLINEFLEKSIENQLMPIVIRFDLKLLNARSMIYIYDLIKKIELINKTGLKIRVIWIHDVSDDGFFIEVLSQISSLNFKVYEI